MKNAIDGGLATGAISAPAWIPLLTQGSAAIAAVGGVVIVILRIAFMIEERNQRRKNQNKQD